MVIYGTALLAMCHLLGMVLGALLGRALGMTTPDRSPCRPAGILLSAAALVATGIAAVLQQTPSTWVLAAIAATFFVFWLLRVTSQWVKIPAFAYARAILEASEKM